MTYYCSFMVVAESFVSTTVNSPSDEKSPTAAGRIISIYHCRINHYSCVCAVETTDELKVEMKTHQKTSPELSK